MSAKSQKLHSNTKYNEKNEKASSGKNVVQESKPNVYLLTEKIDTLIEKHKEIVQKKSGSTSPDPPHQNSANTKESLLKKAFERKKIESLELKLEDDPVPSNSHNHGQYQRVEKEMPKTTKPESKREIKRPEISPELTGRGRNKKNEKNFSTEPSPQSAGGEGKYFISMTAKNSSKLSSLLSPFQERKNNLLEKKKLNQLSLDAEKQRDAGGIDIHNDPNFNNERCEVVSTKSSCHSATLKCAKHNHNAQAVYYLPVESRDFKSNLYFTKMKKELQDYFRNFRARQLEKAKLLTAQERAYYEKLMQEDSEHKLLEYFDKEAIKRLSTVMNVGIEDYPSPEDIKELERLKLDPKSIFFAWLLQNQRNLDRHHYTPVLGRKYSDDSSSNITAKKKERENGSLETKKKEESSVKSGLKSMNVASPQVKETKKLEVADPKQAFSSVKTASPPPTCPKKSNKSKKQDSIKTPSKQFIPDPKTEGYAETKKPDYMKKDINVEVSDFKEENKLISDPELDDFEKRIAEKLEMRIKNFLLSDDKKESPASEYERLERRLGNEENSEALLDEKSKTITLKSLMTMKNFLKPGSLVLAVASAFLSLFAGVVSDIPVDFTKSYTKNLKDIKKIFSSPGSLIAGMNSFSHLVRENKIPDENIHHSSEILEMSKSLAFTPDIPSFVQENIKKLSGYINTARNFCDEVGKTVESGVRNQMTDERAREEFFAQFRKSEPNGHKSEAFENPRQLEISPEVKSNITMKSQKRQNSKHGSPMLIPGASKDEKKFQPKKNKSRLDQLLSISTKKPEAESVVKLYMSKSIDQKLPTSTQQALQEKKFLEEQVSNLKKDVYDLLAKNSKVEWQLERERKKMQKLEEQRRQREEIEYNNQMNKKFQEDVKRKEFEEKEYERLFKEQELRKSREFKELAKLKKQDEMRDTLKSNSVHEQKETASLKDAVPAMKPSPKTKNQNGNKSRRNFDEQYQLAKEQEGNEYEEYLRKKTNSLSWHQREMLSSKEQLEKHYNKTLNLVSNSSEKEK